MKLLKINCLFLSLFESLNEFLKGGMISSHQSVVVPRCVEFQAAFVHRLEDFFNCGADRVFVDFRVHFFAEFEQERTHLGGSHFAVAGRICHNQLTF